MAGTETYVKTENGVTYTVTVKCVRGAVVQRSFTSARRKKYVTRYPAGDPQALAREIGAGLRADGYRLERGR